MKILNLYAGIGGNRKLWQGVEVTAIENNPKIAEIYHDLFPKDKVIVCDAHQYLLEHFEEYDFIWSSPPCPTHSRIRNIAGVGCGQNRPVYPDMKLYEEIIFCKQIANTLGTKFKGKKYCIENVVSYYKPLIPPQEVGRHYFWANFHIGEFNIQTRGHMETVENLALKKGFPVTDKTLLRNCTEPHLGLHILNESKRDIQGDLFR